jgi:hypothetical protein
MVETTVKSSLPGTVPAISHPLSQPQSATSPKRRRYFKRILLLQMLQSEYLLFVLLSYPFLVSGRFRVKAKPRSYAIIVYQRTVLSTQVRFFYHLAWAQRRHLVIRKLVRTMTALKLLAFDVEGSKPILDIKRWRHERPIGISCGATLTSENDMHRWHGGEQPDGRLPMQMPTDKCRELAQYLLDMHASGYTILTWNGLDFDFDILREECHDKALEKGIAKLALNHTDILFAIFSETGSMVKLDNAAKGMGIPGKPEGISGEDAPKLWRQSREMQEKVLNYNAQDVRLTMAVHNAICEKGYLEWITKSGRLKLWKLTSNSIPTVAVALTGPEPDASWMAEPVTRLDFCEWMKVVLPETELPGCLRREADSSRDMRQPLLVTKAWSKEEERRLLEAFDAGADINKLMQIHARSRTAIVTRLHRLGRILPGESVQGTDH